MRKLAYLAMVLMLISAGAVYAAFTGSAHDVTIAGKDSPCELCHTPHAAQADATTAAPLWNRLAADPADFTLYGETVAGTDADALGTSSLACLSCHDGSFADGDGFANPESDLGTDLTKTHPVGFTPTDGRGDVALADLEDNWKLFDGKFECATCHEPHNKAGAQKLYRVADVDLCMGCHDK